jgi:hypothetical protein
MPPIDPHSISPYVIAAVIAGSVTLIGVIVNTVVSWKVWKTTRQFNDLQLEQTSRMAEDDRAHKAQLAELERDHRERLAKDEQEHRERLSVWSLQAAPRQEKLGRLNELQRAAERTLEQANKLKDLQQVLANKSVNVESIFMEFAGQFLIEAAGIFAIPPRGVPNLPESSTEPLKKVRRAVVKVNLVLEPDPARLNGHEHRIDAAVRELATAVQDFAQCVAREEEELTPASFTQPRGDTNGSLSTH